MAKLYDPEQYLFRADGTYLKFDQATGQFSPPGRLVTVPDPTGELSALNGLGGQGWADVPEDFAKAEGLAVTGTRSPDPVYDKNGRILEKAIPAIIGAVAGPSLFSSLAGGAAGSWGPGYSLAADDAALGTAMTSGADVAAGTAATTGGTSLVDIANNFAGEETNILNQMGTDAVIPPSVPSVPTLPIHDANVSPLVPDTPTTYPSETIPVPPGGTTLMPPAPPVPVQPPGGTTVVPPGGTTGTTVMPPAPPGGTPTTPDTTGYPDWLKQLVNGFAGQGKTLSDILAAIASSYGSKEQADALRELSAQEAAREEARYKDVVAREQARYSELSAVDKARYDAAQKRLDTETAKRDAALAEYKGYGAPYRSKLSELYANPADYLASPEVQAPVKQGTDAMTRALSAKVGNPVGNPGALQEIQNYSANTLYGKLGAEKDRLAGFGGLTAYNASGAAVPGTNITIPGAPSGYSTGNAGSTVPINSGSNTNAAAIGADNHMWNSWASVLAPQTYGNGTLSNLYRQSLSKYNMFGA